MGEKKSKKEKMLPQAFSFCFPLPQKTKGFLLKYSQQFNWTKRNCYLTENSSHTKKLLLDAGGHHLALSRLHLHILSRTAINVTTGMHTHSQYTECTMSNLLFERENFSTFQLSHFTSLLTSQNKKKEEENLVLTSLTLCVGRRPSSVTFSALPQFPQGLWLQGPCT